MTASCPTCRVDVITRHQRCPWCDTRIERAKPAGPFVVDELQRAYEVTCLLHNTIERTG